MQCQRNKEIVEQFYAAIEERYFTLCAIRVRTLRWMSLQDYDLQAGNIICCLPVSIYDILKMMNIDSMLI